MPKRKKLVIVGRHRNVEYAERHLSQLLRRSDVDSASIVARRNDSGRFSARGHNFYFELILSPFKLYRWSIGITYPQKGKGKGKGRNNYPSYTLQGWQLTKAFPESKKEKMEELTIQGLEKNIGYPRAKFWFDLESNTGIENPMPSDEPMKLAGTFEITSEGKSKVTVGKYKTLADLKEAVRDEDDNEGE